LVRIAGIIILLFTGLVTLVTGMSCPEQLFAQETNSQSKEPEGRSNPFLTQKEEKALVEMGNAIPLDYLRVSAIFFSELNSRSRAIIDGKVLVLGDSIDNKEIIKINPEDVVLADSQGQYVAKMGQVTTTLTNPQ
jgi:hypothetical protein